MYTFFFSVSLFLLTAFNINLEVWIIDKKKIITESHGQQFKCRIHIHCNIVHLLRKNVEFSYSGGHYKKKETFFKLKLYIPTRDIAMAQATHSHIPIHYNIYYFVIIVVCLHQIVCWILFILILISVLMCRIYKSRYKYFWWVIWNNKELKTHHHLM